MARALFPTTFLEIAVYIASDSVTYSSSRRSISGNRFHGTETLSGMVSAPVQEVSVTVRTQRNTQKGSFERLFSFQRGGGGSLQSIQKERSISKTHDLYDTGLYNSRKESSELLFSFMRRGGGRRKGYIVNSL